MPTRRELLALGGGALVAGGVAVAMPGKERHDEDVPPTEDLMREHGVLRRVLLVYDECARRIDAGEPHEGDWVIGGARIVREFIEDYHERDEEQHVFPVLAKGPLADLVAVLLAQHQAGRRQTDEILRLAPAGGAELARTMRAFRHMYEAHAAREDTVVFPAFRQAISKKELARLQEVFEQKERALPGGGFEQRVADVAALEQACGIYELR